MLVLTVGTGIYAAFSGTGWLLSTLLLQRPSPAGWQGVVLYREMLLPARATGPATEPSLVVAWSSLVVASAGTVK